MHKVYNREGNIKKSNKTQTKRNNANKTRKSKLKELKNKSDRSGKSGSRNRKSIKSRHLSRKKPRQISARLHPNSKRNYQKVKKISPHQLKRYKYDPPKAELTKEEIDQLNQIGGGVLGDLWFQIWNRKEIQQIKKALKEAKKLKKASGKLEDLTTNYTTDLIKFESGVKLTHDRVNIFVNRFRELAFYMAITKHDKTQYKSNVKFFKAKRSDIAKTNIDTETRELKTISSELRAVFNDAKEQRGVLEKSEKKYIKAMSEYKKVFGSFASRSAETVVKYDKIQADMANIERELGEKAKGRKDIQKYKKMKSLIDELMKKDKTFREEINQKQKLLNQKRQKILGLNEQLAGLNQMKNKFMSSKSKEYLKNVENLYQSLTSLNVSSNKKIKKDLEKAVDELKKVESKLVQEHREQLKKMTSSIRELITKVEEYLTAESQVLKVIADFVKSFIELDPSEKFRVMIMEIHRSRRASYEQLLRLALVARNIGEILKTIESQGDFAAKEFIQLAIAKGYQSSPDAIKGDKGVTGAPVVTNLSPTQSTGNKGGKKDGYQKPQQQQQQQQQKGNPKNFRKEGGQDKGGQDKGRQDKDRKSVV